jgi:hypothetical protein
MFWLTIIVGVPVAMISVLTNHLIVFLEVAGGIAAFTGFCWVIEQMLNTLGAAAWSLDSEDVSCISGSDMSEPSPPLPSGVSHSFTGLDSLTPFRTCEEPLVSLDHAPASVAAFPVP